ncbi:MAG: ring-hydroxylating oxygenase subunit alpha [Burkholderiales bacterium RIFCSPHIGHO2_01_FULL_64_960]|nr:MAG: ring-hydroxylating oxygenase subunit alpha [Burkholderiales bacterium RIFCSPHIGHO2_01_FULL_64_960]
MISHEDNETLVRVGPGTAMGQLMRNYWIPFLKSSDVECDGQPHRVRLLGEDLVAFRDSAGNVGLVDHACPHRGAPMVFGRAEDGGIRCIYHGWKFDVAGRCQEMPAEPANSPMRSRVSIKAYPVRERNGVLWAYMGAAGDPPPLPELEWNLVPESQCVVTLRVQECNWLQALEGEVDSAHAAILHGRNGATIAQWRQGQDLAPSFEIQTHEAGISIAARRKDGDELNYVRVNQFLMPFWTLVPPQKQYPDLSGHAWVPIDDHHTLAIMFSYTPDQPLYEKTRKLFKEGYKGRETGHHSEGAYEPRPITEPFPKYWSRFNRANAYTYDYAAGMPGLWLEDAACQSGVAPIYDRTREHLGTSDTGIARVRRMLLDNARKLAQGAAAPAVGVPPTAFMKRAISITIPSGADWTELGRDYMKAELGKGFGYTP